MKISYRRKADLGYSGSKAACMQDKASKKTDRGSPVCPFFREKQIDCIGDGAQEVKRSGESEKCMAQISPDPFISISK